LLLAILRNSARLPEREKEIVLGVVRSRAVSTTATRVTNKGDHEREGHRDHAHPNERAVAKPPVARRKPHTPPALRVTANRSPEYREPYAHESESDNRDAQQRHATGGGQRLIGRRVVDRVVGVVHAAAVVLVIGRGVVVAAVNAKFARRARSNTISEGCWSG
jgi:hypothetical protein